MSENMNSKILAVAGKGGVGKTSLAAVSGLAFTSSKELVEKDEIILYGPDLNKLAANSPYARITFVRVNTKDFLQDYMDRSEGITNSLNHIFTNINMDCGSCGFKNVCDEVEGLRELHFAKEGLK